MNTIDYEKAKVKREVTIPFPNFQPNTIISSTQLNDNFEELENVLNHFIETYNMFVEELQTKLNP